jgi:hypothetical protein
MVVASYKMLFLYEHSKKWGGGAESAVTRVRAGLCVLVQQTNV